MVGTFGWFARDARADAAQHDDEDERGEQAIETRDLPEQVRAFLDMKTAAGL